MFANLVFIAGFISAKKRVVGAKKCEKKQEINIDGKWIESHQLILTTLLISFTCRFSHSRNPSNVVISETWIGEKGRTMKLITNHVLTLTSSDDQSITQGETQCENS